MSKVKMINFRNLAPWRPMCVPVCAKIVQKQKDGEIMTHFLPTLWAYQRSTILPFWGNFPGLNFVRTFLGGDWLASSRNALNPQCTFQNGDEVDY